jgi:hypothetical protein
MAKPPDPALLLSAPTGWVRLTTLDQTAAFVRKELIAAFGDTMAGQAGQSWIAMQGGDRLWYVLETVEELIALLG